ncbi:hypothetical protein [Parasitella parasitica]|uniref:FAR1 domain-containing protein n=1 Tax=Parasitella parasitica TaxID=35722 RepID=A0A0B7NW92_9FUNG|nr:hypothetical protein [Parasitella parasitica]
MEYDSADDDFDTRVGLAAQEYFENALNQFEGDNMIDIDPTITADDEEDQYDAIFTMSEPEFLGPFDTKEDTYQAILDYSKSEFKTQVVQCDLAGDASVSAPTVYRSTSTRMGCRVQLTIKKTLSAGVEVVCDDLRHNHGCNEDDVLGHAANRRLNEEHLAHIKELIESVPGIKPRFIISALQNKFPDSSFHITSIYNVMSRLRRQELDGRTPVKSMIDFLATRGEYRFEIRTNDAGEMKVFFFTHRQSIEIQ